jgi:N-acetylglucosaminyl-diphospho-decaprenol L-rhamnosyltransferase
MDHPLVSAIVVAHDSADVLPACLSALAATDYPSLEVLVVDNASNDSSAQVAGGRPGVRVVGCGENLGFGRACNLGAASAGGDVLVFLNPDVVVTPAWLSPLVEHLRAQPDVAILCPTTARPDEAVAPTARLEDCPNLAGAAMAVPRPAWEWLGGFDEEIFLYWEDTDLCWRAWLGGRRVVKDHESIVRHERGGSGGGLGWSAEQVKNGLYVHLKLMPWARTVRFAVRMAAKTALRMAQQRDPALLGAWAWNLVHLPATLRRRRNALAGVPSARRRRLLALQRLHAQWQSRPEALPFSASGT